jgi:hypothetical protein
MSDLGPTGEAGGDAQVTDTNVTDAGPSDGSSGDNPAWGELLGALPTQLHSIVKPHLSNWDKQVQQRFQTVQSQYEPYKQFIDQKVDPQQLMNGMQVMQMLASDPRAFYDRMTQHYADEWGLNGDQGPSGDDEWDDELGDEDDANNPLAQQLAEAQQQLESMRGNQDTMAQFLAAQVEKEYQQQADKEVEQEFKSVSEKYGELTPAHVDAIVSMALQNNINIPQAADRVFALIGNQGGQQAQQRPVAPRVVPTNGGSPAAAPINPGKLSGADRRALVRSILEQNANHDS